MFVWLTIIVFVQKLLIFVYDMKFGLARFIHPGLNPTRLDRCSKFKVFLLPGNKVISAYRNQVAELRISKKMC